MSYDFILGKLPFSRDEIFVDASSSWGIGGFLGYNYFYYSNRDLRPFHQLFAECTNKTCMDIPINSLPIAYLELLAAMLSVVCFAHQCQGQRVRLNCDNPNAVAWLQKSRCPAGIGFRILSVVELYELRYQVKIATCHIMGEGNSSADSLSRGVVPGWLKKWGEQRHIDLDLILHLLKNPVEARKHLIDRNVSFYQKEM